MLETNNPYMFASTSSTSTTTTQQPPPPSSSNSVVINNNDYYQGQPARLNSAFNRHQEEYRYLYKNRPSSPIHTLYSPTQIKRESSPLISPHYNHKFVEDREPPTTSWMDTGENKKSKRRKEMNTLMEDLNQDFLKKKERLYLDKLTTINQELKDAKQDKHALYLEGLKDLEKSREKMIKDGILFREYQNQVTENQFRLEIYQAEEEYTAETQEIREKLFNILEEKRRKLKEEKDNCDLAYDVVLDSSSRLHKRNLRKRGNEHLENKSNKKKQTTGPAFVFKLKDEDILSDLQAMKSGVDSCLSPNSQLKKALPSNKKK